MDTTKYNINSDTAKGIVDIEKFIPSSHLAAARDYKDLMTELTLSGNIHADNRTEEEQQKDLEAIELLKNFHKNQDNSDLAYGFMLYNESSIVKIYWAKRVGKLRAEKYQWFSLDKYLEWLTNIFEVLNGEHSAFVDPLYYYKFKSSKEFGNSEPREVNDAEPEESEEDLADARRGHYDIMNSFRVWWNRFLLPKLAAWLYKQDLKYQDYGISIEQATEEGSDTGMSNHLEAEIAEKGNFVKSPEEDVAFKAVEDFLRAFTRAPLNGPVPLKAGTKALGMTYRDYMIAIADGSMKNASRLRSRFNIGLNVQERIMQKIKKTMDQYGVDLETFAEYLHRYQTLALDILNGSEKSFTDE